MRPASCSEGSLPVSDNPYHVDGPVPAEGLFVGRRDVIAWVWQGLEHGERLLLIEGAPYMGKSSLLLRLAQEADDPYTAVYLSLKEKGHAPWPALLERLSEATGCSIPPSAGPEEVAGVLEGWDSRRQLIILLDDLDRRLQDEGDVSTQAFLGHLAALWELFPRAALVCAVCSAERLRRVEALPFRRAPAHRLEPLTRVETMRLIRLPAEGRLEYEYEALERIDELTGRRPYFVQLLCSEIFARRAEAGRASLVDVDPALEAVVRRSLPVFESLWERAAAEGKIILSLIGALRGEHEVITPAQIAVALRAEGIEASIPDIQAGLELLEQAGALEQLGATSYRPIVEMFRFWLRAHHPPAETLARYRWNPRRIQRPAAEEAPAPARHRPWTAPLIVSLLVLVSAVVFMAFLRPPASSPPASPTPTPGLATLAAMLVGSVSAGTPVPTPPPQITPSPTWTATPTKPLVLARPLPAIAYMSKKGREKWQVWVMGADGSLPTPLTAGEGVGENTSPVWSPEGKRLAFVSDRDGNKEIYLMNIDGSDLRNLTNHEADDWTPAWSPDGTEIAFSSMRDGNWEIYIMWSDGSYPVRLTNDPEADIAPAWSPDGKWIAFASRRDGDWDIYVMDRSGGNLKQLTNARGSDLSPAWSPDGRYIAFESNRDGNAEIYLMQANGEQQQNLTRAPHANDHWPAWSPDGTRIAFCSNRDGEWGIYIMRIDGGDVVRISPADVNSQAPAWRP